MFFLLLMIVALAARTTASPIKPRASASDTLYFITNDPQGNYVVAANIDASGNVSYAGVASAGGAGVHGQVDPAGPVTPLEADATFSQGIVQVHQRHGLLATVNTANHTVVLFAIDPLTPGRLTMLGEPVSSGGTSPNSLVFNEAGDRLWVLNTGSTNGIACFAVSQNGLQPQADTFRTLGLNQTTPSTGPFGAASQIIYSQDEKDIIVAVKGQLGVPGSGFLAVWPLDEDGNVATNFTRVPTPTNSNFPFSMTPIAGSNAYLAADLATGLDIFDFNDGVDSVASSPRTTAVPIVGQHAACWSTYSSALDRYYVVDVNANTITPVEIDSNLTVSIGSNFTADSGPIDSLALSVGEHSYLYTLLSQSLQIGVWRLDGVEQPVRQSSLDLSVIRRDGASITANYTQGMAYYKGGSYYD
ncbi:hypothetical protein PENSPDRAFT_685297 [Peniophora sp. CONT]|nr:hypothetical protein PENSPDRAFT_685297 [Peniophora sp. CONT]